MSAAAMNQSEPEGFEIKAPILDFHFCWARNQFGLSTAKVVATKQAADEFSAICENVSGGEYAAAAVPVVDVVRMVNSHGFLVEALSNLLDVYHQPNKHNAHAKMNAVHLARSALKIAKGAL